MEKGGPVNLERVSETLEGLAELLRRREQASAPPRTRHVEAEETDRQKVRLALAEHWARDQQKRYEIFDADLFFDPAWNMLVDLYIQTVRRHQVSVSSLCVAANVSMTTALRWIKLLERRDLVTRTPDPFDKRSSLMRLTSKGREKMEQLLDKCLMVRERAERPRSKLFD